MNGLTIDEIKFLLEQLPNPNHWARVRGSSVPFEVQMPSEKLVYPCVPVAASPSTDRCFLFRLCESHSGYTWVYI